MAGFWDFLPYVGKETGKWEDYLDIVRRTNPVSYAPTFIYDLFNRFGSGNRAAASAGGGGGVPYPQPKFQTPEEQFKSLYSQYSGMLGAYEPSPAYKAAMSGLEKRYADAKRSIANRQKAAQKVLSNMPADLAALYTEGDTSAAAGVNRALEAATAMPEGYALPTSIENAGFEGDEIMAPVRAGIKGAYKDRLADVDVYELGTESLIGNMYEAAGNEYSQGLTALELAQAQAEQQAKMQREQMILDLIGPQLQAGPGAQLQAMFPGYTPEQVAQIYHSDVGKQEISMRRGYFYATRPDAPDGGLTGARIESSKSYQQFEKDFFASKAYKTKDINEMTLWIKEEAQKRGLYVGGSYLLYKLASQAQAAG